MTGITRRRLLAGAALGGGAIVAWTLMPRSYPTPLEVGRNEYAFDAWIKIGSDGVITVAVPQLEMGQGVTTLLPQIVAMELGADWRQVAVEPAPPSGTYANIPLASKWSAMWMPFWDGLADEPDDLVAERFARGSRFTGTADGTTLAAYEMPCREAAAAARAMLAMAAADRWGVSWEECQAISGFIFHGEKRLSFAELAEEASGFEPPDPPPLLPEPPAEKSLPGEVDAPTAYPRLDLPSKVDGTYQFAGDVRLPDMVYAGIRHGPIDKAVLTDFNPFNARGIRGIVGAVKGKRWLAVAARSWWAAERALETMQPRFSVESLVDSDDITERLDRGLREGEAYNIAMRGDGYSSGGKAGIARIYEIEAGVHAPLETASATARIIDGRLELWVASQAPELTRKAVAKAVGFDIRDVVLYPMSAGGSFDRRLEHDHAIEAALIAQDLGRPVQLIWSRWQELLMTRPRQPAHLLLTARLSQDGQGNIDAMKTRIATPPANIEFGHRLFDNTTTWAAIRDSENIPDPMSCEGAMPAYDIGHVQVDHVPVEIGLPCSRMRGNSHAYTAFAIESFIDEIAHKHAREPLSFRIGMLGADVRLAQCLQRAARLAEWGGGVDQSGQGIACHRIGDVATGGRIACIASARAGEGGVRVTKLTAAVDIGRIVNLDLARQQIEGGLVFGLAMAMGASTRYRGGLPVAQQMSALNLPKIDDCPEIEVEFIDSSAEPFDPGELGAVVAAPAIANALFSSTGLRLRRLPLISNDGL